jgi:hypothetical protein
VKIKHSTNTQIDLSMEIKNKKIGKKKSLQMHMDKELSKKQAI